MKLLFGTGNQAKLSVMKSRLEKIGIELIGLNDLRAEGRSIPEVIENGNSPLENARLKALAYYEAFQMPVFSCDSGLLRFGGYELEQFVVEDGVLLFFKKVLNLN